MDTETSGFFMKPGRLNAFFDAVLAIIMTILVLGLQAPDTVSLDALWQLRTSFVSYAMSFFWLGSLWVHTAVHFSRASRVSRACLWWSLILLFFCSLLPLATSYLAAHFHDSLPAFCYVIITLLITLASLGVNQAMRKANQN